MVALWRFRFRRTTILLCFSAAVLVGLVLGYWRVQLQPMLLVMAVCTLAAVCGRANLVTLLSVLALGVAVGCNHGALLRWRLDGYGQLYGRSVVLQVVSQEDAVYGKHTQFTFVASSIVNTETGQKLPGKIGVSGFGLNMIYQGDVIQVTGKLRPGIGAYQGFTSFAKLSLVRHQPTTIANLRRSFGAGMLGALPEPLASFSMGLLIGQRATLPDQVKQNLLMVGLTHIIAVSGYNLTIMLEASRKVFGSVSKRLSTAFALGLMTVFVLMTGTSPSIIRAAVVSVLSIAASYYGHRPRPLLILAMVAALTAYDNPIYIWSDASWYLSFLAFFGVLMVSPLLQARLPKCFETSVILAVAVESICAEIMSLPYILFTFGQMSFIGLVGNMLVVTLVPLAMLLGLIAGLVGMFLWPIAGWFAWPAKFLLMYMLDTAQVLAGLPHVFVDGLWLTLPGVIGAYLLIAGMTALLHFKDRTKNDKITDKGRQYERSQQMVYD